MEQIKQSIFDFLADPNLKVLAITGDWGIGKTHFWKNIILKNMPSENHKEYYSYVSLFNIETINDLKTKLYYESYPCNKKLNTQPELSYIDSIHKSMETLQKLQKIKIDNHLICFDDIERKSDELKLKTFLGYVSELKELDESKNKIVIIFNYSEMESNDKLIFDEYKEKIFDMVLLFNPTDEYNQNIIFKNHLYIETIKNTLKPMTVTNMRILNFIKNNINYLITDIAEDEYVKLDIISKVIIITWLHYQKEIFFKIKDLENFFSYYKPLSDDEEKIRNQIINYGYEYFEDYHREIISYVINGYLNIEKFTQEIKIFSKAQLEEIEKQILDNAITKLWSIFNSNFVERDSLFIIEAENLINEKIKIIPYDRLQKIIDVINKIDKQCDTQKYIDRFIEAHTSSFKLNEIEIFLTKTSNDKLITDLNSQKTHIKSIENLSLKSVIYKMVEKSSWSMEDEVFLDSHSKEEIYIWLKNENDPDLLQMIRSSFRIFSNNNEGTKRESFGQKLYAALVRIWKEGSPIDKLRITACLGLQAPIEEKADSHPPSTT